MQEYLPQLSGNTFMFFSHFANISIDATIACSIIAIKLQ